ncbi:MAG TPA: hypothetical protein VKU82_13520 [Planctomycetaceae bacterium]|nr:hypothetical protein [Planctomycetaceae bacterium]
MLTAPTNAPPPEARGFALRLPRPLWIGLLAAVLAVTAVGMQIGAPAYRQRVAIREIEHFNGSVQFHPRGPDWLRKFVGERQMECFDKPWHVIFWVDEATLIRRSLFGGAVLATSGPLIDDAALACVLGLPDLESLDLAFSNVTDAGLDHVRHLRNLEFLRLEGTDVSDASIVLLSQMRSLKELNVEHTRITKSGGRALEAALPGCEVRGPHNDRRFLFSR